MDINFSADPAVASISLQHAQLAARTANLKIISAEAFTEAAEWLKTIKSNLKQIEDARVRITQPLNESLREINSQARLAAAPYLDTEGQIKRAILSYNQGQERIRLEAQRRADAAAAAERKRLQDIADTARRKADAEAAERRKAAEAAAAAGRAEEATKLAAQAARIEEKGQAKQEQFESRAQSTVAPVVQTQAPKVTGVGERDNWTFHITDANKINVAFLMPDTVKIGKIVKSLKLEAQSLVGAGVEIYNDKLIASRTS
jgi:hypothetical protein